MACHDEQIFVSLRCMFGCLDPVYHFFIGRLGVSATDWIALSGFLKRFRNFDVLGPR